VYRTIQPASGAPSVRRMTVVVNVCGRPHGTATDAGKTHCASIQ
jgi:hypothetical protein